MKKNCIIAQSGGPTPAINASLAGVVKGLLDSGNFGEIYGSLRGITGTLKEDFISLSDLVKNDDSFLSRLYLTPAMYLGSCRHKLPDYNTDFGDYERLFKIFERNNIGAFFYIGGNDSMDTAAKLAEYGKKIGSDICFAGIPKTIDNDLVLTDHTPGYGSAAKFIATSMLEMAHDTYIYGIPSVTIVEIMGRDAGWLTAASVLARNEYNETPQLIYLPEVAFDEERFINDVNEKLSTHKNLIVAVSEGIRDKEGNYIAATKAKADKFGHAQLSGAGKVLEHVVKINIGVKCRSVELNIPQRCAGHISSKADLDEAMLLGYEAVKHVENGRSGFMTAIKRTSDNPYTYNIEAVDVSQVANAAKSVPLDWISPSGNDVTEEMIAYIKPLIQGEVALTYKDGLPEYLNISHLV
ncbi:6-phosphofructokinase 1 [Eubacterium ruminantium]|nr:6-phosphofructokinase 1 [Eubacterium ruminantium]